MSTVPRVGFQGIGDSVEAARDDAAGKAFVSLVQKGLTNSNLGSEKDE